LTEEEINKAIAFVDAMRKDKIDYNVVDRKFDAKNTSYAVNLMGHLGEVAVAKFFNAPLDDEVKTGGDEGWDTIINGKRIQVKTSTLPKLIFNSLDLFVADYAILVQLIGERNTPHINSSFVIHGCISRDKFKEIYYEKDYGYGVRCVVDSDKLDDITSL
jgi:hypothetical protein